MKYLITGIGGFVGPHLVAYLMKEGHEVVGVDATFPEEKDKTFLRGLELHQISLMDYDGLKAILTKVRPERIVHLASASSVALSWEKPVDCFVNNTNIFLNLVEAVRTSGIRCRILSVGSSEEYGPVSVKDVPLREDRMANPMNPYAVARVAQEHLSKVYSRGYGLDIVCTRSFNHLGPGQTDRFVVSSFVRQAVEVAKGRRGKIICGSLDIVRDFIDVRDVVKAYDCILESGVTGEIYNVCSGKGVTLKEVLDRICGKLGIAGAYFVDPSLIRPIDNPVIIGNNSKLARLKFTPAHDFERSIDDMIAWWQARLK